MGDVGVVVDGGLKTIHICATEPVAHFLVALTTERVFGLLQMLPSVWCYRRNSLWLLLL